MANQPYVLHKPKYGVHQVTERETGENIGTVECIGRSSYKAIRPDGVQTIYTTRWEACWHLIGWHTERRSEAREEAN